jgi:hypothetical protein
MCISITAVGTANCWILVHIWNKEWVVKDEFEIMWKEAAMS